MKKFLIFFVLAFTLYADNGGIVKKTSVSQMSGTGVGLTREEAVNNAILEALGKLDGVKISSKKFMSTNAVHSNDGSFIKDTYNQNIQKATNGRVDSYSIDDVSGVDGNYEARVTIKKIRTKKSYKTPGFSPHSRRKIAVVPIYASDLLYEILGKTYGRKKVTLHLTQEVVNAITQTRKFSVLDREATQAYDNEKALLLSGDAQKDELARLKNVLGTDYLYILNVADFHLDREVTKSDLTGKISENTMANATIEYRIIVMATRQIKYSHTQNFSFAVEGGNTDNQILTNALQTIAKGLTEDIVNNIYPMKIAGYSGSEVILSQKLPVGARYEVFRLGKKIYDSYTKEAVGYDEQRAGLIEITRSNPKMSYARVLEGSPKKGDLCRLAQDSTEEIISDFDKPSDIDHVDGGGVVLPFD